MQQFKCFKFEISPKGEHVRMMRNFSGAARYVYNRGLAIESERLKIGEKRLRYVKLCKLLTGWRNDPETAWLKNVPTHTLQQSLRDLESAYHNFYEHGHRPPRFKKKGNFERFRFPDGFTLDESNSRVKFPRIGWIRYRNSRNIAGSIRFVTVKLYAGKWFMLVTTLADVPEPVHPSKSMVGIDLGVRRLATLSDGTVYDPTHPYNSALRRIAKAHRSLDRKKRFSSNWKKALNRLGEQHRRIAAIRRDMTHKASSEISKSHAIIVMEDIIMGNISKSARGTVENHGRNVCAKSGLNRAILDQGWGALRSQIKYKQVWAGGLLLLVAPHYTSQTCLACGCISSENRISQDVFKCISCGFTENADIVASVNVLERGHRLLACGEVEHQVPSTKQEPAEMIHALVCV